MEQQAFCHGLKLTNTVQVLDSLILFEECVIKHFDRIQPDRILNMQVMFGHIHIGMANQTLDCSEINTQRLHLRYISMTTAVRSQGPNTLNRSNLLLKFLSKVRGIAGHP